MSAAALAERAILLLIRLRWVVVGLLLLLVSASWAAIGAAVGEHPEQLFDNRLRVWFKDGGPELTGYEEFQRRFGNDEAILIALPAGPGEPNVFTPATLGLVAELSGRVAAVPGVKAVTSLATVIQVRYEPGSEALEIDRPWKGPIGPEEARHVERRLTGDRLLRPALVSPDGKTTLLTVQLLPNDPDAGEGTIDVDAVRGQILDGVAAKVRETLADSKRDPEGWHWGGLGVINEELNRLSQRDLTVFFGLSLLTLVACVSAALRRAMAVVLTVVAVHVASLFLNALYLGLGHRFNLVTTILPTLVLVVGVTDSIFFVSAWYQSQEKLLADGAPRDQAIAKALSGVFLSGLFNSITTSVGFFSFLTAEMPVLRDVGLFAGVGILLAFACSISVMAVGLYLFEVRPPGSREGRPSRPPILEPFFERLPSIVLRWRGSVLCASIALVLFSIGGVLRINVDTLTLSYLRPENPVRQADAAIQRAFGPYLPLEVVVEAAQDGGILDPALLLAIDRLEATVAAAHPEKVGGSTSIAGVVKRLHEAYAGSPQAFRVPESRDLIEQLLLFYDPARSDDPLRLVDFPAFRRARITFRTANDSARAAGELVDEIEQEIAPRLFPPGTKVTVAGYVPLYVRLIDYLVQGQIWSICTSFLVVFGLIALLFRSLRAMIATIPANVIPVLATLGFMGWVGIDLDVGTVLIAAVALGIAVDDTIHFIFDFQSKLGETGDARLAVEETMVHSGPPIVSSSLILACGFSVLCLAQVKSVALFGLLMAVTMVSAVVSELFVTPVFVMLIFRAGRHPPVGQGL